MSILDDIVAYKRDFVAARKRQIPLVEIKERAADMLPPPAFLAAIHRGADEDINVIAEVKKKSPSKGIIREDFDPIRIAIDYAEHDAAAISVLTDEQFFDGRLDYLRQIRGELTETPLLRKDFTIDEYQIYEAREAGAAAILLITGILDKFQLVGFRELAEDLGMAALTEVHTEREADFAAEHGARIVGVNNRDLNTFDVDLKQTQKILQLLGGPRKGFVFVAESGISKPAHVEYLRQVGVDAILVGESLMREPKPGKALVKLLKRDEEAQEKIAAAQEQIKRGNDDGFAIWRAIQD
ncbi:MAG: indole-3-glycerol phosphate synthase TrpC [Candidatus Sumerlaeaceae bacterium]|nr:indole-3-glycerol phosphate synthase TrpC [Candidatus Sumerlaeaceae bacterium]